VALTLLISKFHLHYKCCDLIVSYPVTSYKINRHFQRVREFPADRRTKVLQGSYVIVQFCLSGHQAAVMYANTGKIRA